VSVEAALVEVELTRQRGTLCPLYLVPRCITKRHMPRDTWSRSEMDGRGYSRRGRVGAAADRHGGVDALLPLSAVLFCVDGLDQVDWELTKAWQPASMYSTPKVVSLALHDSPKHD
jgi:hypothetical protein